MASFLLGRTKLAVGPAVAVLPNHHPVALPEETALLHHLSGGRFAVSATSAASARPAGRLGVPIILSPFGSVAGKRDLLHKHARAATAHGHRIDPSRNIDSTCFAIADTTEAAREPLIGGPKAVANIKPLWTPCDAGPEVFAYSGPG